MNYRASSLAYMGQPQAFLGIWDFIVLAEDDEMEDLWATRTVLGGFHTELES